MISFKSLDQFTIKGRGTAYIVELDQDTKDFSHLLHKEVAIDDKKATVIGVERYAHCPPWHAGERISLLTRDPI
jgi:hypothetical protein